MSQFDPVSSPADESVTCDSQCPFWDYHDLILLMTAAIPSLLLSAMVVRVGRSLLPQGRTFDGLLIQFLAYGILFLGLFALLRVRYGRPFWESLGWRGPRRRIVLGLFTGPLLAFAVASLGLLLHPAPLDLFHGFLRNRMSIFVLGLAATIIGPICEELAFRGFLQPLLSRTFGAVLGIVLTNFLFALMHGPEYSWSWRYCLLVGLAGLAFGAMRHRTGSTAAAATMHATYNLTWFIASVLQKG
jgi:membrane protease YdiL (CAAX protease family)